MSRYFLHLRNGSDEILDPDGIDFHNFEALRKGVLANARDLVCGDARRGAIDLRYRIDAQDETGAIVHSLAFADAVAIIPDAPKA